MKPLTSGLGESKNLGRTNPKETQLCQREGPEVLQREQQKIPLVF